MNTKINLHQYFIFIKLRKFDTADIKCFTVVILAFLFCMLVYAKTYSYVTVYVRVCACVHVCVRVCAR